MLYIGKSIKDLVVNEEDIPCSDANGNIQGVVKIRDEFKLNGTMRVELNFIGHIDPSVKDKLEERMMQDLFPVCNKGLMDYLLSKGYRLKSMDDKNEYRGIRKNIYYFYEPEKVRKEMQSYYARKRMDWVTTSTWQLFEVTNQQMVDIVKVDHFNSLYIETDTVDISYFLYSLEVLNDSELFQDAVEWECNFKTKDMPTKCDLYIEGNINAENMIMIYVRFREGVSAKDIIPKLMVENFEEE